LEKIKGMERKAIILGGERNLDLCGGSGDPHLYHVVFQTPKRAYQ